MKREGREQIMDTEKELIKSTLAGSVEAYRTLYEITVQDVYRTVRFLVINIADSDDIVQEIYISVYRSLQHYDLARPFRPWLMTIAIRQIQTYRRQRWRQFRLLQKAGVREEVQQDFSSELTDKMSRQALIYAVNKLPFKLKQVVILHYLNQYTQEEIAEILSIPLGTVKSRIHAALQKLRKKQTLLPLINGKVENWHES